jgi:hypothetical protein
MERRIASGSFGGAAVVSGVSALGVAPIQTGVPKNQAVKYETALKADKYVLMVRVSAEEMQKARSLLASSKVPEAV